MKRVLIVMLLLALPVIAEDRHMGVATCASSVCHGSTTERSGGRILQNEYVTWWQQDPHARAYQTLLSDASRRMANKLGIGPAHEAPACLACHADAVPEAQRGPRFQLSDGVGCEACHGGAERWLSSHTEKDATHEDNLRRGLTALPRIEVRAAVCGACHVGDGERFASHDIMGAGHPRLQFELATYHRFWPSHHRENDAYRARKPAPDDMALWRAGQLYAARHLLQGLRSERFMATPFWPELAYFDCHACHTPMNAGKWQPREASALPPGAVRLNDSALLMVGWWLAATDPAAARRWREAVASLHGASQQGRAPVRQVSAQLLQQLDRLQGIPITAEPDWTRMLAAIKADALGARFSDYMTAEQVLMVIALLERPQRSEQAFDELYRSLADQHRFDARAFLEALRDYEAGR